MKNKLKRNKRNNTSILVFLWILLIIYGSGDSALGATYKSLRNILVIIKLIFIFIVNVIHGKLKLKNLLVYMVFSITVIMSMFLNFDFSGYSMFLVLGIGICVTEVIAFETFYKIFEDCVLLLSISSLIGLLIFIVDRNVLDSFSVLQGGGSELRNLYLTAVPLRYSAEEIRNYGIFREPAMFAIYIGLSLLRELFYVDKVSVGRFVIFTITMISTRSFTGYLVYGAMVFLWLSRGKWDKKKMSFVLILLIVGYYMVYHFGIVEWVQERLNRSGGSSDSINSRIASVTVNTYIFVKNFWFGAGAIRSQQLFYVYLPELGYEKTLCSTNMITYLMASYGVIFIIFFITGVYKMGFYASTKKNVRLGLCIIIFMLLCAETMTYSSIIYIFMFYGWNYVQQNKLKLKI